DRLALADQQIAQLEREHAQTLKQSNEQAFGKERRLRQLRAVGKVGAWVLVQELFGWRRFNNRRQLAGSVGLGSSPHSSGARERDQGINKAGNARVRTLSVELAWQWLRFHPDSALATWYLTRLGGGNGRSRRVG